MDKDAFDKVFNEWEDKYFELLKKIGKTEEETSEKEILTESNEDKSELISNFIEDLYDLRKDSIATEGEYGIGNLVFKEFRNLGYLDNLKDLKNEERSKELSLENLKEDIDDDMQRSVYNTIQRQNITKSEYSISYYTSSNNQRSNITDDIDYISDNIKNFEERNHIK